MWPSEFLLNRASQHSTGVDLESARQQHFPAEHRWQYEYNLWGYLQDSNNVSAADAVAAVEHDAKSNDQACTTHSMHGKLSSAVHVQHQWFYKWRDFVTPDLSELAVIQDLARNASAVIRNGGKVLISCYSGRGR